MAALPLSTTAVQCGCLGNLAWMVIAGGGQSVPNKALNRTASTWRKEGGRQVRILWEYRAAG